MAHYIAKYTIYPNGETKHTIIKTMDSHDAVVSYMGWLQEHAYKLGKVLNKSKLSLTAQGNANYIWYFKVTSSQQPKMDNAKLKSILAKFK